MANGNGDYISRFERLEKLAELHTQQIAGLIEHAALVDKQIELLRGAISDTNTAVQGLIGSVRELIDRIPPENLR